MDPDWAQHFVQIVCEGYQQTTKVATSGERVKALSSTKVFIFCTFFFLMLISPDKALFQMVSTDIFAYFDMKTLVLSRRASMRFFQ